MPTEQKSEEEYTFKGQRSDERVVLVTNQHIWLLMPAVLVWLGLIALLVTAYWLLGPSKYTSIAAVVVALIGGIYSFYIWYIWNNSNYIITSQRVIKIDQVSFFNRMISEADIDRIQEISTEITGPIRTVLNFGVVKIQTASNESRMNLDDVTDPYSVQQVIVGIQKDTQAQGHGPKII